jgi:hypothetical protein
VDSRENSIAARFYGTDAIYEQIKNFGGDLSASGRRARHRGVLTYMPDRQRRLEEQVGTGISQQTNKADVDSCAGRTSTFTYIWARPARTSLNLSSFWPFKAWALPDQPLGCEPAKCIVSESRIQISTHNYSKKGNRASSNLGTTMSGLEQGNVASCQVAETAVLTVITMYEM